LENSTIDRKQAQSRRLTDKNKLPKKETKILYPKYQQNSRVGNLGTTALK
jgi:hypothetical protein